MTNQAHFGLALLISMTKFKPVLTLVFTAMMRSPVFEGVHQRGPDTRLLTPRVRG